jgi:hypothetical protein
MTGTLRGGPTPTAVWAGRIISGLAVTLLLVDAFGKLAELAPVVDGTVRLGFPAHLVFAIGLIELCCALAYAVPRSSILGAILLTGYLGGAVATHVRVGSPVWTHDLTPIYLGLLIWGGLLLRDRRLRTFIPLRSTAAMA